MRHHPRAGILVCIASLVVAVSACIGSFEVDLTLFDRVDLGAEIALVTPPGEAQAPGAAVQILRRAEVDLGDQLDPEIAEKMDGLQIDELWLRVPDNTMTADLEGVRILIGPVEALSPLDPGVVELTRVARIPARSSLAATPLLVGGPGQQALQERLIEMKMVMLISATVRVQDPQRPPSGAASFELDVKATIRNDP